MTKTTWTDYALRFSASMTLAVFVIALVVAPLSAQYAGGSYNPCTACIDWVANSTSSPCAGKSRVGGYMSPYALCVAAQTPIYCSYDATVPNVVPNQMFWDGQGRPPCSQGLSQLPNCESDLCNEFAELAVLDVSLCSNSCFGKECERSTGNICKNIQISCDPRYGSHTCTKCACANR